MQEYRFYVLSADGSGDAEFFMESVSDDEACEIANALLDKGPATSIEVWRNGKKIYQAMKQGLARPISN